MSPRRTAPTPSDRGGLCRRTSSTQTTAPKGAVVGRRDAKQIVITIPEDIGCAATDFHLWTSPRDDIGRYATQLGSTIRTWIVDSMQFA